MGKYSDSEIEEDYLEEQEEDDLIDDCHYSRSSQDIQEEQQ